MNPSPVAVRRIASRIAARLGKYHEARVMSLHGARPLCNEAELTAVWRKVATRIMAVAEPADAARLRAALSLK